MTFLKTLKVLNIFLIILQKNDIDQKTKCLIKENFKIIIKMNREFNTFLIITLNSDIVRNAI